jgi:hypothetical protein
MHMRTLPKTELKKGDKDFNEYQVTLDGIPKRQDLLVSADATKGEVVCRRINGDGYPLEKQKGQKDEDLLETSTGFVMISRRPVYEPRAEEMTPGATTDETKTKGDNPAASPQAAGQVASAVTKETVKA